MKVYAIIVEGKLPPPDGTSKRIDVTQTVCENCIGQVQENITMQKEMRTGVYKCSICKETCTVS